MIHHALRVLTLIAVTCGVGIAQTSRPSTYPVPYESPTVKSVAEVLQRVHGYLDTRLRPRVVDRTGGKEITDLNPANPVLTASIDRGEQNGYEVVSYPTGVIYSGMLLASEATGDARYNEFVAKRLTFIHDAVPYFRAIADKNGVQRNPLRMVLQPEALDDCGAMSAALIKARRASIGPDLMPVIERWLAHVSSGQFRLPDGQLARHRPQPESIWGDDAYMSIPALAEMGKLTGDSKYYDDAVRQSLGFAKYLFVPEKGIYMHGRNLNNPDNPEYYWARANGWIMMANVELLNVLPEDHPKREEVIKLVRAHAKGLANFQGPHGLWRNMLDKPETPDETSATAMFVFGIARAVNRGWISPVAYGSIAMAGWNGITTKVNKEGGVEATCIGTTFASDNVYYMNRPLSVHAPHGYGPVLLAGAEMVKLLENKNFTIQFKSSAYHFVPKGATTAEGPPPRD